MIYFKSIDRNIKIKPLSIEDTQLLFSSKGYFTLVWDFVNKVSDITEVEKEIVSLQDIATLFVSYRSIYFPSIEIAKGYYPIDFIHPNREGRSFVIDGEIYNSSIKMIEVLAAENQVMQNSNEKTVQQKLKMAIVACSHQGGYTRGKKILRLRVNENNLSEYYLLLQAIEECSSISLKLDTKSKDPILIMSNGAGGKPVIGVPFRASNFFAY